MSQTECCPPPPPLPACGLPTHSDNAQKKKLYQTIASSKTPVEGDYTEARLLLSQRESSFRTDLQWILVNAYVPSLIQDGPQNSSPFLHEICSYLSSDELMRTCLVFVRALSHGRRPKKLLAFGNSQCIPIAPNGVKLEATKLFHGQAQRPDRCGLVALWMAAQLRQPPMNIEMCTVTQTAVDRGYTAQGEMFSAQNMARLAEEACCCKVELLSGGLRDENAVSMIKHLWDRQPVLIPYDEDFNHAPCKRSGQKAHWAVASGVLLGFDLGSVNTLHLQPDPSLSWLYLPTEASPCPISTSQPREVHILAKQGKSLRYQIWSLDCIAESNEQLRMMDPQKENNGTRYVLPEGGVEAGLLGQAVLLHTRSQ